MHGKMIIISAPSGAGKTTIVKEVLSSGLNLMFSISACSRAPRKNEIDGKDYCFLSTKEFQIKIEEDAFIEWEEVYSGNYYGTLKSEVHRIWDEGHHVIFDVDVKGGISIKNKFPDDSLAIFIQPPSVEELEKRLRIRSTETDESIKTRIEKAEYEMGFAADFDIIVVNDRLDVAVDKTYQAIKDFLTR